MEWEDDCLPIKTHCHFNCPPHLKVGFLSVGVEVCDVLWSQPYYTWACLFEHSACIYHKLSLIELVKLVGVHSINI